MEVRCSVLRDSGVGGGKRGVVAVGLMVVLPEELGAEMVLAVELVIKPGEEDVLLEVAREGGEVADEELSGGETLVVA